MAPKEQNINQWDFKDIAMSVSYIVAIMFLYMGLSQMLNLDQKFVWYSLFSQAFFYMVLTGIVFYYVMKSQTSLRKFFGLYNPLYLFWVGVFVFGLMITSTSIVDIISTKLLGVSSSEVYKNVEISKLKEVSLIGVFFAPFAEEIFFRGFMQPVFVRKFGFWMGIILVGALFSFLHLLYVDNISALIGVILVGFILSFTKEKTQSLIPCMLAHFLNNLAAVYYLYF